MKSLLAVMLLLLAIVFSARASPTMASELAQSPMRYIGPVTPGGEDVILEGHAGEIHKQIMAINPRFDPMDFEVVQRAVNASLKPRDLEAKSNPVPECNIKKPGFTDLALQRSIFDGIAYIRNLPGDCKGVGHHTTRVSCSRRSAIYLVVSSEFGISRPCQYLADLALAICNDCERWVGSEPQVNGQIFDSPEYMAIVAGGDC